MIRQKKRARRVQVRPGNALSAKIISTYEQEKAQAQEAAQPAQKGAYWHLGLLMIGFGIPLWFWGASYSLDGWILGLEKLGPAIKVPIKVPSLPPDLRILLILTLGVCYSLAEVFARPPKRAQLKHMKIGEILAVLLGLVLAHGSDLGSTYLALANPGPNASPLAVWVSSLPPVNVGATIAITYLPELLIVTGAKMAIDVILYPYRWMRSRFGG